MVQQVNYGQCVAYWLIFFHPLLKPSSGSRRLNRFWENSRNGLEYIFEIIWENSVMLQ